MTTADFVRPVIYNWSIRRETKEEQRETKAMNSSSASLIDDIAAIKESQQVIPRSEVTPMHIQSPVPKVQGSAIDINTIMAKYSKPVRAPRKKKAT